MRRLMVVLRPRTWTLLAVATAQLHFAYRAFGLHVALETAAAFVAFLVAHLFYGRFRQSGQVDDLALTLGLGVIACANGFFAAIPAAVSNGHGAPFSTWAPLSGRLIGEALFAFAAFAPRRRLAHPRRTARVAMLACFALLVAVAVGVGVAADRLRAGIDPNVMPAHTDLLEAPMAVMVLQAAGI